jgi:hypothetical protein
MRLSQHPEYTKYLQDRETVRRCRQALAAWRADGEPIHVPDVDLCWTPERALAFVRSLVSLFRAYNQVLWEEFPYCRACGGGCCVLDASHVGPFDGIALATLDLSAPALPEVISASARECVYLDGRECTWPVDWRTIKCWSFYCLGGRWDPGASLGEHHGVLATALKGVVLAGLPEELRQYERVHGESLIAHLDDPTAFAHALDDALFDLLAGPLHARYPLLDDVPVEESAEPGGARSLEEDILAFVAQAMEELFESPPPAAEEPGVSTDQLLADLELLEWIAAGHPSNGVRLLEEMHARYAAALPPRGAEPPTIGHRMRECIVAMLETCQQLGFFAALW